MFIRHDYSKGEILKLSKQAEKECKKRIDDIVKIPKNQKTFQNTVESYEDATNDYSDILDKLSFMSSVSTSEKIRKESTKCEELASKFISELNTRRDIYLAVKEYLTSENYKKEKLDEVQKRLLELTMKDFKRSGMELSDSKLKTLKKLSEELGKLSSKFSSNINENKDTIILTEKELDGMPNSFKERLKKKGKSFVIPLKPTFVLPLLSNVNNPEVRKRIYIQNCNKESKRNVSILEKALKLRQKEATLLGFSNYADYALDDEMAKNEKTVKEFLLNLREKLKIKYLKEKQKIIELKKELQDDLEIHPWDIEYYFEKIRQKDYNIDSEKLKEYFPLEKVIEGMFSVYSKILGVEFREIKSNNWAPEVKLYEVLENDEVVSYFYTDLFPREGKYSHAAAFTLVKGRLGKDVYIKPISAIVANFTSPTKTKPSLLSYEEVSTFFHEFGHIMHQTLTKVRYGSMSGTSTTTDFVEAPSQMMENWVSREEILPLISSHYKDKTPIPKNLVEKIKELERFNAGYFWLRQITLATVDQRYHTTKGKVNTTKIYKDTYEEILEMKIPPVKFQAAFGHLMGGYGAKYYGYTWSKVFAEDMFTLFNKNGVLDEKTGLRYKRIILESGDLRDPDVIIKEFLGREQNQEAFLRSIGL